MEGKKTILMNIMGSYVYALEPTASDEENQD